MQRVWARRFRYPPEQGVQGERDLRGQPEPKAEERAALDCLVARGVSSRHGVSLLAIHSVLHQGMLATDGLDRRKGRKGRLRERVWQCLFEPLALVFFLT